MNEEKRQKKEIVAGMAACLISLNETEGWTRSMLYIALGSSMGLFTEVERFCVSAGYIETSADVIKITDTGRELARNLEASLGEAQAEQG